MGDISHEVATNKPQAPRKLQLESAENKLNREALPQSLHVDIPSPVLEQDALMSVTKGTPQLQSPALPLTEAGDGEDTEFHLLEPSEEEAGEDTEELEIFTLALDLGEDDMEIEIPLPHELLDGLQDYFDGCEPILTPKAIPFDMVSKSIEETHPTKLWSGHLYADEDDVELAELADHLADDSVLLLLDLNNVVITLFPTRGNVENDDEQSPNPPIGFELRIGRDDLSEAIREFEERVGLEPDPDTLSLTDIEDDQDDELHISIAEEVMEHTFGTSLDDIFSWPTQPRTVDKKVFLLMDDDREAEIECMSWMLRWAGISVLTPDEESSWD